MFWRPRRAAQSGEKNQPDRNDSHAAQSAKRFPNTSSSLTTLRAYGIPISTVLDVGVQYGSPELCKACPDLPHILFEPVEEFYRGIAYNYRDIAHEIVSAAVSDHDGEASLEVRTFIPGVPISHSTIVEDAQNAGEMRRVPMISIDRFLAGRPDIKAPYLLKIDIDGLELKVIAGAMSALRTCSAVVMELHIPTNFFARCEALKAAGFKLVDIVELAYYRGLLIQVDGIFLREDLLHHLETLQPFDFTNWQNFDG